MRSATIQRKTNETDIALTLLLEGTGKADVQSGVGFLDHMLTLWAARARFDLTLRCVGDTGVDDHHTVEDVAICLGDALAAALGDRRGICRYGEALLPMDETLIQCALDISGRGGYYGAFAIPVEKIGTFDTQLADEFFTALARRAGITLHLRQLAGVNGHHILEGAFKALGRALRQAAALDPAAPEEIPSTKGVL